MSTPALPFAWRAQVGAALFACACDPTPRAETAARPAVVPVAPQTTTPDAERRTEPAWAGEWQVETAFHGAEEIFGVSMGLCATTPGGVRCQPPQPLGALDSAHVRSPTDVWGYVFVCGVGHDGALLCSHPSADRASEGPPRLVDLANVTVHAAAHRDGTLSVTTNRETIGYSDPRWAKVRAVTDAIEVASSWYADFSCYLRRTGDAACVDHDVAATPTPLAGVTDGARIRKTDQAIWVLTRGGRLLATRNRREPLQEVLASVVDFAPNAAAPGARPPAGHTLPSEWADVPCAVREDGQLLAGLGRDWTLKPVPGAGDTRRVFGAEDWICAVDAAAVVRCVREQPTP
jgi:hypothetical protein